MFTELFDGLSVHEDWLLKYKERHRLFDAKAFCLAPIETVKKLIEQGLVKDDSIAQYLVELGGIHPRHLRYFFRHYSPRSPLVEEYISQLDLQGVDLDEALRYALRRVSFTDYPDCYSRSVAALAERWFKQNRDSPGFPCASASAAEGLLFTILRQPDQHCLNSSSKTPFHHWLLSLADTNEGADFPEDWLAKMYARLAAQPLRIGFNAYECSASLVTSRFFFGKQHQKVVLSLSDSRVLLICDLEKRQLIDPFSVLTWTTEEDHGDFLLKVASYDQKIHVLAFRSAQERAQMLEELDFHQRFTQKVPPVAYAD